MSSLKKHVWDGPDPVSRVFCESSFQACLFADEEGPEDTHFRPEKTNMLVARYEASTALRAASRRSAIPCGTES